MTDNPHKLFIPISIQKIRCKEREIQLDIAKAAQPSIKERLEQELEKNKIYCELLSKQTEYHINIFCRLNNLQENIQNWNLNAIVLDIYRRTLQPPLFIGLDDDQSGHLKSCKDCFNYCLWVNSYIAVYPRSTLQISATTLRDQIIQKVIKDSPVKRDSFQHYCRVFQIDKWPTQ